MKDYRNLSDWEKNKVDTMIRQEVEPKHHTNKYNGFKWKEPDYTLNQVHSGNYCADCLNIYYNCLCGHN